MAGSCPWVVPNPRPLLAFGPPSAGPIPTGSASPFPPQPRRPNVTRQGERLTPQFDALRRALEGQRVEVAGSTAATDPELVVVFDLVSSVDAFMRAVRDIEGLEFLVDLPDEDVEPDDDFFFEEDGVRTDQLVPQSLYMLMSNAQAVAELVRLFQLWQQDPTIEFETGLNPLKTVFASLRAIRQWGPEDRVRDSGLLEKWREELQVVGRQGSTRVEVELWYRGDAARRGEAEVDVRRIISDSGGSVLASSSIDAIRYHALLAQVPTHLVERAIEAGAESIELLATQSVMFVSPSIPMAFESPVGTVAAIEVDGALPTGAPRVALLDGLPLENHSLLANRLVIDDPDDFSTGYGAASRYHGTAMASIAIHGDLSAPGLPMRRPLYVRPVLVPDPLQPRRERTPPEGLLVDLVARCFIRMFEGDGNQPAQAPSVRVVNLSIGDPARMFVRQLSPLAKLLDWYAHRFNLLIIVSGGNQTGPITVEAAEIEGAPEVAATAAAKALFDLARTRRMLSPAEAVNVVTVGAVHADEMQIDLPATVVELTRSGLPASYSPVGHGYRRAIKPEVLFPGGRQLFSRPADDAHGPIDVYPAPTAAVGPGIRCAAPGDRGDLSATIFSVGTSNSAALASRAADQILETLETTNVRPGERLAPDAAFHPVLTKALLVHAAGWDEAGKALQDMLGLQGHRRRAQLTQLLGYGPVDVARLGTADRVRAVLIGTGAIGKDKRHTFEFPLPPSLSTTTWWRRLTITLAWLSPINCRSQRHRMARLSFTPPDQDLRVTRTDGEWHAVRRGTVQHEVLEGEEAVVFDDGKTMTIHVDCRVDAGSLAGQVVRYALVASIEVREEVVIDLHEEVATRLRARIRPRAQQRA